MSDVKLNLNQKPNNDGSYIKKEEKEKKKMFANKKANIAIGICFGIVVAVAIFSVIYRFI